MQKAALELEGILHRHYPELQQISRDAYLFKSAPGKWSKQEIMGHLVDSAENNIRRFITAQYEDNPVIVYNQDAWVKISHYQQWEPLDIIQLWYLLNKQICAILRNTPVELYDRVAKSQEIHSIQWLAQDYIKHLLHHLHVVLELEPISYP